MIWQATKPHNLIGVVFTDEKILLAEIYNKKPNFPEIRQFAQLDLCDFEIINLSIFNQTKISRFINDFIITNKLQNLPVIFCLDGSKLTEFYGEKPICENKTDCDCQICKIYSTTKANFEGVDYYCQLSYSVLFQYKLLAINIGLNLVSIITDIVAINKLFQEITSKEIPVKNSNSETVRTQLNKKLENLNLSNKVKSNFLNKQNCYEINQLLGLSYIF